MEILGPLMFFPFPAGIKAVFSGHYHRNAGGTYQDLDMVVSSAIGCQLGKDTHGLRVVVVTAEKIVHRYYSLDELSEKGIEDDLMDLLKKKWLPIMIYSLFTSTVFSFWKNSSCTQPHIEIKKCTRQICEFMSLRFSQRARPCHKWYLK